MLYAVAATSSLGSTPAAVISASLRSGKVVSAQMTMVAPMMIVPALRRKALVGSHIAMPTERGVGMRYGGISM